MLEQYYYLMIMTGYMVFYFFHLFQQFFVGTHPLPKLDESINDNNIYFLRSNTSENT